MISLTLSVVVTVSQAPPVQNTDLGCRTQPAGDGIESSTNTMDHVALEVTCNLPEQTLTGPRESQAESQAVERPTGKTGHSLVVERSIGKTRHSLVVEGKYSGKPVAVKTYRRPDDPVARRMWRIEVHALKALRTHQNVAQILRYDSKKFSIIMELAPGMSLDKYIDHQFNSILTETQCMDIWLGAAQGLQWVHQHGFLYNDLKAENTMYDPLSRRTVLIDFGLASSEKHPYFKSGGTPCYLCPEVMRGERYPVSDIWALAVVMLFSFGLLELPRETWDTAKAFDLVTPDRRRMQAWHDKLSATANHASSRHVELLQRMLRRETQNRIQVHELVARLQQIHHT